MGLQIKKYKLYTKVKFLPVKVFRCTNPNKAVRICQLGENSDFVAVFKLSSDCHLGHVRFN